MKRNIKLLVLLLSLVTVASLALAVNASAANPEVKIAYKNVAYTEAPQLVLYVDAENVGAGQSVKVMFYDEAPESVTYDAAAAKAPVGKIEFAGKEYDAVYSDPCAPAQMRVDVYAVALVVDSDGNIAAQSDVLKYNVFEYAMDRFSMSPTADQTALYTALLNFGASVQEIFYTDETIDKVGGWTDAYYGIKLQHVIEGEVVDSSKFYSREAGSVSTVAPAASGEYSFAAFENLDGTPVTDGYMTPSGEAVDVTGKEVSSSWRYRKLSADSIGYTTYNMIYTDDAKTYTFDEGTTIKSQLSLAGHAADGFLCYDAPNTAGNRIHVYNDGGTMAIKVTEGNDNWGCIALPAYKSADNVGAVGSKYIMEFDFMYADAPKSHNYSYFGMIAASSPAASSSGQLFANLSIAPSESTAAFSSLFNSYENSALNLGQWYNIRFEYEVTSATEDAYAGNISYYVDGIKIATVPINASNKINNAFGAIYFEIKGQGFEYKFDNIYTSTIPYIEDEIGDGGEEYDTYYDMYVGGILDEYTTIVYDMNETADPSEILTIVPDNATGSYARIENGALVLGAGGTSAEAKIAANLDKITAGSTIIIELDYKLTGHGEYTNPDPANHQLFTLGLVSDGADDAFEKSYFYKSSDGSYTSFNPANAGFNTKTLAAGEWYNLRIEIKTTKSDMTVSYYVDGNLLDSFVKTEIPTDIDNITLTMLSNVASQEHILDDIIVVASIPEAEEDDGGDTGSGDNTGSGGSTGGDSSDDEPVTPVDPYKTYLDFESVTDVISLLDKSIGSTSAAHAHKSIGWYIHTNYVFADGATSTTGLTQKSGVNTTDTFAYMDVITATQKDGTEGEVLISGTQGALDPSSGGWKIDTNFAKSMKSVVGTVYTVEMDFKYEIDSVVATDIVLAYFGMNGVVGGITDAGNSGKNFAQFNLCIPKDGDGSKLSIGSSTSEATINESTWYTIRVEYTVIALDDASTTTSEALGEVKVYIEDILSATYTSTNAYNAAFEALYLEMRGPNRAVQGQRYWIDNLTMSAKAPASDGDTESFTDGRGTGVYYNKYMKEEITGANYYDFAYPSNTTMFSSKKWNIAFNNKTADTVTDIVISDKGIVNVTTEGYSYYAITSSATTAAGETWVGEFDYMYNGCDAQGTVGYLKVYAGDTYKDDVYYAYAYVTVVDSETVKIGGRELAKGVWYNIRIELTDKTGKLYIDDAEVANGLLVRGTVSDTGYASPLHIWFEQGNTVKDSSGNAITYTYSYSIDNVLYDNISVNTYNSYYDAYTKGGEYQDAVVYDFDTDTTLAKGEELLNTTTATIGTSDQWGYINVTNNAALLGYSAATTTDSTKYQADFKIGLSAEAGQTYIVEYDLTFGGSQWNTGAQGVCHSLLDMNTIAGTSTVSSMGGNRVNGDGNGDGTNDGYGAYSNAVANGAQVSGLTFQKDQTYKIRVEITVVDETTVSISYFVDNANVTSVESKTIASGATTLDYLRFNVYACANQTWTIDNMLFAVVTLD